MKNSPIHPVLTSNLLDSTCLVPDSQIIDSPSRLLAQTSGWQQLFLGKDKSHPNNRITHAVKEFFQQRYDFHQKGIFKRTWRALQIYKKWNPASLLTLGKLRAIDAIFKKRLIYHGPGIMPPKDNLPHADATIKMVVRSLLHGGRTSSSNISSAGIKALFLQKDETLLHGFRMELQHELDNLVATTPKNPQEELLWRAFLGNVVALLPYTYPHNDDAFHIPILSHGVCRRVEYKIHVMPLSLTSLSSPMTALGLTPLNDAEAPPMLVYIGTTYPAGEGFATTVLADFTPNHSVGEAVYKCNQTQIDAWLKDKTGVHAIGASLGGALALHTLRHHADKLNRLDAYNPPGLYENCWQKKIDTTCKVNIYRQAGDLVSELGFWPDSENVSLYAVLSHQENVSEDILNSHARAFTGLKEVTILKQSPDIENKSFFRRLLTKLHQWLGPILVWLPIRCFLILRWLLTGLYHAISTCCLALKARLWTHQSRTSPH